MASVQGTSSQHEMTSIAELSSNRYSAASSRAHCPPSTLSLSRWTKAVLVVLLLINLGCIAICGWFAAKFLHNSNKDAAVWAIFTASICCGSMTLFVLHLAGKMDQWHNRKTLQGLKLFSMGMCSLSGTALGVYIVLGFLRRQNFETSGENFFSAAVFSGFCFGCNILLYFNAQWYQNILPAIGRIQMKSLAGFQTAPV